MITKGQPTSRDASRQEAYEPILLTIGKDAKGGCVGESGALQAEIFTAPKKPSGCTEAEAPMDPRCAAKGLSYDIRDLLRVCPVVLLKLLTVVAPTAS